LSRGAVGAAGPAEGATRLEDAAFAPAVNRMAIALLSLIGVFVAGYLLLHKLGYVGELVCGAGSCDTVQASSWAVFLGVPVPAWGVGGYASIFAVALAGLQPGLARDRRIGLVLFGLGAAAFAFSAYLTAIEAFVLRAWCRWCVASACIATSIFLFSLAELRRPRSR